MEEKKNVKIGLDKEMGSLVCYRKELAACDKEIFDKLLGYAKNHASACARSEQGLLESMLLAIVLEQQKMIDSLTGERGDSKTRRPDSEPSDRLDARPSGPDLPTLFASGINVKEGPPWAVC